MKISCICFSVERTVITLVLVLSFFFLPTFTFPQGGTAGHLFYPISHANIWHLAANVCFLWLIKCRLNIIASYLIAVLCSFLPSPQFSITQLSIITDPTMGFSGVLFAVVGVSWGNVNRFKDMVWRNKWFLIIPFFIPHVNALIHLYCLLGGYLYGLCEKRLKQS